MRTPKTYRLFAHSEGSKVRLPLANSALNHVEEQLGLQPYMLLIANTSKSNIPANVHDICNHAKGVHAFDWHNDTDVSALDWPQDLTLFAFTVVNTSTSDAVSMKSIVKDTLMKHTINGAAIKVICVETLEDEKIKGTGALMGVYRADYDCPANK